MTRDITPPLRDPEPRVQHALAAPPGRDPGGPARNVPIRVGDLVRARDQSGRCDFDFWARVTGTSDAASEYVRCVALDGACEYHVPLSCVADHRAAPRIVLPDGREVTPSRMWTSRRDSTEHAAEWEGGQWYWRDRGSCSRAGPPSDGVPERTRFADLSTIDWPRVWPPAECEGA